MKTLFLSIIVAILLQNTSQATTLTFNMSGYDFKWSQSNVTLTMKPQVFKTKGQVKEKEELIVGASYAEFNCFFPNGQGPLFIEIGKQTAPDWQTKKIGTKTIYVKKETYNLSSHKTYTSCTYNYIGKNFRVYQEGPENGKIPVQFISVIKSIKVVKSK